ELRHQGHLVNSKKVRRLMREHGLSPKQRRRYVATTDSDHDESVAVSVFITWRAVARAASRSVPLRAALGAPAIWDLLAWQLSAHPRVDGRTARPLRQPIGHSAGERHDRRSQ